MLNLIKDGVPGSCCLGIGDGANDVAMIKVRGRPHRLTAPLTA